MPNYIKLRLLPLQLRHSFFPIRLVRTSRRKTGLRSSYGCCNLTLLSSGNRAFLDGAFNEHLNNPTQVGIEEAKTLWNEPGKAFTPDYILSIGTGKAKKNRSLPRSLFSWAKS